MDRHDHLAELQALLTTRHRALLAMVARRIPRQLNGLISAEDVVQEASLDSIRSLGDFRPQGEDSMWRWVCRIVRHRLCDLVKAQRRLKRAARFAAQPLCQDGPSPVDQLRADEADACPLRATAEGEAVAALRRAIAGLPGVYRDAIELRYVQGLPVAEVAARLGRTTGAASMLCNRGLARLRRAMRPEAVGGTVAA